MSYTDEGGLAMKFDLNGTVDSVKDGIVETAEVVHVKTNEFHENYVTKVIPDCGKYGDAAKFVAEMAPGVAEYNAIKDGDWQAFAITAGIDIAAVAVGVITAGAGYAAVKGGTTVAKAGVKVAAKEVAEAGAKRIAKEAVEAGTEKIAKEVVEAGTEKIAKETVEAGVEKAVKETTEAGAEQIIERESVETVEKQIIKNKQDGMLREEQVLKELTDEFGDENIIREALIRDKNGMPIKDIDTGEARRIDFIVKQKDKIVKSIEVTSETAPKALQTAKELRILEQAKEIGGAFIKDPNTGALIEFPQKLVTEIRRLQ